MNHLRSRRAPTHRTAVRSASMPRLVVALAALLALGASGLALSVDAGASGEGGQAMTPAAARDASTPCSSTGVGLRQTDSVAPPTLSAAPAGVQTSCTAGTGDGLRKVLEKDWNLNGPCQDSGTCQSQS